MNNTVTPQFAKHQRILPAGTLQLTLDACHGELENLIGFAARANPRRPFLFLSKVLGKHLPVTPATMATVHQQLAAKIPEGDGTLLFIGMAETATGLGQGVFEAWRATHPNAEALYLHTTRYRVNFAQALHFEESHSHAPRLMLHLPRRNSDARAVFESARRVVLVDDELSTGNTFVNLVRVLRQHLPQLAAVHLLTICDFMGAVRRHDTQQRMGLPCSIASLARGHWQFSDNDMVAPQNGHEVTRAPAQCEEGREVWLSDQGYGRLGRQTALLPDSALVDRLASETVNGSTLVLGTGEFMHPAFVLARALADRGGNVFVQATTRSPIQRWGDVRHIIELPDPYGEDIPHFIYNLAPGQHARVLVCHEVSPGAALVALADKVGGRLIHFGTKDHVEEIPVYGS